MASVTEERPSRGDLGEETPEPAARRSGGGFRLARRLLLLLVLLAGLAAVAYSTTRLLSTPADGQGASLSTYQVEPGELLITVTEDGNVESASNIDIKCQVAGGSAILWIIEDGKQVKKGDKLVELDASALEDEINTQKITYSKAQAAVIQSQKNYDVAQIAVQEYEQGTLKKEVEDATAQIIISEESMRSAQNSLAYSERMFQRGYISELELEAQQFAVRRATLELDSANTAKTVLEKFTKIKTLTDLKSQVETAKATMKSDRAAFALEESKLRRLETQLANCTIVAPQDGMVVYANERSRFGQQSVTIEEGATVRDRQTIFRLPDLSQMQVKVKVHETKVDELRPGLPARINIQRDQFQGVVTSIGNQPEPTSWFSGNVKEYGTLVEILGTPKALRPGMTAEVEILVARLQNILMLPVSAVVELRGKFCCWVKTPAGGVERRALLLGKSNDKFVEVQDGVKAGDLVVRNPRAFVAEASANAVEADSPDAEKKFGDVPTNESRPAKGDTPNATQRPITRPSTGGAAAPTGGAAAPTGGPRRQRGDGGPRSGNAERGRGSGEAGTGGRREGPRGALDLSKLDANKDGEISKDEAPERMKQFFDQLDGNHDGVLDAKEISALQK